jgi:transcription elongation factor Elf1
MTLRTYQRSAVDAIIKGFGEFRTQLRVCPTGGGHRLQLCAFCGLNLPLTAHLNRRYCSNRCRKASWKTLLVRCQNCGKEFKADRYRKKEKIKHYSIWCHQSANGKASADRQRYRGAGKAYVKFHGRHLHRALAEQKIDRALAKGEIVHHADGNRGNNAPGNLHVTTQSKHIRLRHKDMITARKRKCGY